MKINLSYLLILPLLFAVVGCSKDNLLDIPNVGIPDNQLNKDLSLAAFPTFNTFKIGKSVNLEVRLETNVEVEISPDSDAQIFILNTETKEWETIQEIPDLGVFEAQTFVLSVKDGGVKEINISMYPNLPNRSEPVTLLIVVTGDILQDGKPTNHKTGAFIIVELKP